MAIAESGVIHAAAIPKRYARGWHMVGKLEQFSDNKPHKLHAFGTKLVVFKGDDQRLHVLNAYCVHMGGDLSEGQLVDGQVVCPFHAWKWNGSGKCTDIPYCKRIPPKAKTKSWPTLEKNGLLFVWNDPEELPPDADVEPPLINATINGEWMPWEMISWKININCRELVDNVADIAHFGPVHGAPVKYYANIFDRHIATQVLVASSERLAEDGILTTRATYYGPAYQITEMTGQMAGQPIHALLLNSHVPIDANSFTLNFGVMVKKYPGMSEEHNRQIAQAYVKQSQDAFAEDVRIWENKIRIDNPVLCEADGPIYQLRQWYQQFYVNRSEVATVFPEKLVFENAFVDIPTKPTLEHVNV